VFRGIPYNWDGKAECRASQDQRHPGTWPEMPDTGEHRSEDHVSIAVAKQPCPDPHMTSRCVVCVEPCPNTHMTSRCVVCVEPHQKPFVAGKMDRMQLSALTLEHYRVGGHTPVLKWAFDADGWVGGRNAFWFIGDLKVT
jgi:hypothetical protein